MATRRGPKPAKDRLSAARQQLDATAGVIRAHKKVCADCRRAGQDTARLCDEGWQLLKQWTRQRNRVTFLTGEVDMQDRQGVLF